MSFLAGTTVEIPGHFGSARRRRANADESKVVFLEDVESAKRRLFVGELPGTFDGELQQLSGRLAVRNPARRKLINLSLWARSARQPKRSCDVDVAAQENDHLSRFAGKIEEPIQQLVPFLPIALVLPLVTQVIGET